MDQLRSIPLYTMGKRCTCKTSCKVHTPKLGPHHNAAWAVHDAVERILETCECKRAGIEKRIRDSITCMQIPVFRGAHAQYADSGTQHVRSPQQAVRYCRLTSRLAFVDGQKSIAQAKKPHT